MVDEPSVVGVGFLVVVGVVGLVVVGFVVVVVWRFGSSTHHHCKRLGLRAPRSCDGDMISIFAVGSFWACRQPSEGDSQATSGAGYD
jgi:hypothetical protein